MDIINKVARHQADTSKKNVSFVKGSSYKALFLTGLILSSCLSSCSAVAGIFQAGMSFGIFIVVLVIVLIIVMIVRAGKK